MKVSKHVADNIESFSRIVPGKYIMTVLAKAESAIKSDKSTACVVTIPMVDNPIREDWEPNDRLVAIVRNGQLKTVMLSRASQINKSHLRTSRII